MIPHLTPYLIEVSHSPTRPFVHTSVQNNLGTPFLVLQCKSAPSPGALLPSHQIEWHLKDKLMGLPDSIQPHDGLEMHGIITYGPRVRFYRLMANRIFGCCLWEGKDHLHILDDHDSIAQHLTEIKSDWLSTNAPGGI
ncbi:uncharacterized protein ACLA_064090 [Aspergillus clavatus NRRL 1]|uniref:Uncharacterized protein n=1 Tax=Aspergillus clavatus (strain ATCC 1007 / CBS 513.65 / DSM 816 / NCTC 3887 / NRRL 1 / QM 1276 / 107) TaxID=344612 RepID=A1CD31_ASPCL|nr:uncharacterized protein ACLA_064090 [Aspergillus clavatus NRRL 1]EAW12438.1 conserved hypothetical protein [Aspergillus clavatus NRRL 1]